jgi:FeS assembly SUF system protein
MTRARVTRPRTLDLVEAAEIEAPVPYFLEDDATPGEPPPDDQALFEQRIIAALRAVYDPEIPLNIYDLGLIYRLETDRSGSVRLTMTLTAPGCPIAGELVRQVHSKILGVRGVTHARTELVWDPPWSRDRLTVAARLELGLL